MSQDTEHIGQASADVERIAAQMQGWGGNLQAPGLPSPTQHPETLAHEITDPSDYSFRDRRANKQALGWSNPPPMAGYAPGDGSYWEPPMAAQPVTPIDQFTDPS